MIRYPVLNIGIHACHYDSVIPFLYQTLVRNRKGFVTLTGVHGAVESYRNLAVANAFNAATLNLPDGMPMVWIGQSKGYDVRRVYGPTLMLKLLQASVKQGSRHFLYGGKEGVAERLKVTLMQNIPGLNIVGTHCPPFRDLSDAEMQDVAGRLDASEADFIWVGLSTPKQELFMHRVVPHLQQGILLGVGAAFDFHIGAVRQAPAWIQGIGMEWLFRLAMEPKRLWRRYLFNNPLFIYLFIVSQLYPRKFRENGPR